MSEHGRRGPIVIDTDVFSADLVPRSALAQRYAPIVTGRPAFVSFQTAAEVRYGALRRGWGEARMLKLEAISGPYGLSEGIGLLGINVGTRARIWIEHPCSA